MRIQASHPVLREFFDQLRFAPSREQHKHLGNAEKLLILADAEKDYPFDFIVFRITGKRLAGRLQEAMISGRDLQRDLRLFLTRVSGVLSLRAAEQAERITTVTELAGRYSVSTKTVRRWQKQGLAGRIYVFEDGRKRLGFSASTVEAFFREHGESIERAGAFSRLRVDEKEEIVRLARTLQGTSPSRNHEPVLREIVRRTGRSREAVRTLLAEHDKQHPDQPIFSRAFGRLSVRDRAHLYKQYQQGIHYRQLMERFSLSQSSVHRVINQQRARGVDRGIISYIDSPEFYAPHSEETILSGSEAVVRDIRRQPPRVLSRSEEGILFRRYNFLKYLAAAERSRIDSARPSGRRLDRIERTLQQAEETKNLLLEVNLPLVISVAGKHAHGGAAMGELISEGNVSLMRAVEKFDYTKGYRFSTYANLAIAKDFARKIPAEKGRPDRAGGSDLSRVAESVSRENLTDLAAVEQAQHNLRQIIEQELDERERYIVLNRFPVGEEVIPRKAQTLKEIGHALGLSKERIRQIELQALQKLRHRLSPEEFDLLIR